MVASILFSYNCGTMGENEHRCWQCQPRKVEDSLTSKKLGIWNKLQKNNSFQLSKGAGMENRQPQFYQLVACFFSAIVFKVLMLRFISNPISTTIEFRKIMIITTMMVPIEPQSMLYLPKLLTNAVNPMVTKTLKNVATTAPGDTRFHLLFVDGA